LCSNESRQYSSSEKEYGKKEGKGGGELLFEDAVKQFILQGLGQIRVDEEDFETRKDWN
jgi:hypothetical protein